jgi:hypothetical protein
MAAFIMAVFTPVMAASSFQSDPLTLLWQGPLPGLAFGRNISTEIR